MLLIYDYKLETGNSARAGEKKRLIPPSLNHPICVLTLSQARPPGRPAMNMTILRYHPATGDVPFDR